MIIESLESEKNGSLKSNRVPTGAYWVPNILLKKNKKNWPIECCFGEC